MLKFIASIYKEFLVLIRDIGGLIILFLMPVAMIFIITLVQDSTFRSIKEAEIPLLLVNMDKDTMGNVIERGLIESNFFTLETEINDIDATETTLKQAVSDGKFQIGIVIPKGITDSVRKNTMFRVTKVLSELGMPKTDTIPVLKAVNVKMYFDPVIKKTLKNAIITTVEKIIIQVESKFLNKTMTAALSEFPPGNDLPDLIDDPTVVVSPVYASKENLDIIPNSTQHNVPAWTLFAMFFIVIPMSISMIKERDDGSLFRLLTMPGSYFTIISGNVVVYLIVCLIQFALMLMVGIFLLPLLGLPKLILSNQIGAMALVAFSAAFAAIGFGIMVGSLFKTHQQASSFGAVSIIILAALGGVWVPVYLMPEIMRHMAGFSPLNWGLNGFYNIFVRSEGVHAVMNDCMKLLGFFIVSILIAIVALRLRKEK